MKNNILDLIEKYWKFDEDQQPISSWHDKQDLLKVVEEELIKKIPTEKELEGFLKKIKIKKLQQLDGELIVLTMLLIQTLIKDKIILKEEKDINEFPPL